MVLDRGTTFIEIRAKLDALERDLNTAEARAKSSGKNIESRFDKVGTAATKFGQKTRIASGVAGLALIGASKAASNLNETMSFTEVTFKGATDSVVKWSKNSLDSMGIAQQSALDAANQFGGLFQITGSTADESAKLSKATVQLAVDMSSAKNVRLDEAILALGSGLRGEAEPMRRFNVLLSEAAIQEFAVKNGIAEANAELTEGQKVQARYGLILEQTKDIQGDYARTADSSANAQRRAMESGKEAAAELGQNLAPITAKLAEVAADAATAFGGLPDPVQKGVVAIGGMLFLMSPLATGIGLAAKGWKAYTTSQIAATLASKGFTASLLGKAGLVAGVALLAHEIDKTTQLTRERQGEDTWFEKILSNVDDLLDSSPLLNDFFDKSKKGAFDFGEAGKVATEGALSIARSTEGAGEAANEFGNKIQGATENVRSFAGMTGTELREWRAGTVGNFNLVEGALGELADKHRITADVILRQMRRALNAQLEFGDNWRRVARRGGEDAEDFLRHVQENYGAKAPQIVAALANANDREFRAIIRTWNRAERNAGDLSKTAGREFGKIRKNLRLTREDIQGLDSDIQDLVGQFEGMALAANIKLKVEPVPKGGPTAMGRFPGGTPMAMAGWAMSAVPGYQAITSGYRPGDTGSFHAVPPPWNAVDIGGTNLPGVFNTLRGRFGASVRELIYGHSIVQKGVLGYYPPSDHFDHVHLADMGAIVRGPALIAQGNITEAHIPLSGPGAGGRGPSGDNMGIAFIQAIINGLGRMSERLRTKLDKITSLIESEFTDKLKKAKLETAKHLRELASNAERELNRAIRQFERLRDAAQALRSSVVDSIGGFADLSSFEGTTESELRRFLNQQREQAGQLARRIQELARLGLNQGALGQILSMGAEGIPLAQMLLSDPALVKILNETFASIGRRASETGAVVQEEYFGKALGRAGRRVERLSDRFEHLDKRIEDFGNAMNRLAKELREEARQLEKDKERREERRDNRRNGSVSADLGAIVHGPAWIHQGAITEAHIPLSGPGIKGLRIGGVLQTAFGPAMLEGIVIDVLRNGNVIDDALYPKVNALS